MKESEVKLKKNLNMLSKIEDLVGKTVTSANTYGAEDECAVIKCGDDAIVLKAEQGDRSRCSCCPETYAYLEVSTDPIGDFGVEYAAEVGLVDPESYAEYKAFREAEIEKKKRRERRKMRKEDEERKKRKYENFLKLKEEFEK